MTKIPRPYYHPTRGLKQLHVWFAVSNPLLLCTSPHEHAQIISNHSKLKRNNKGKIKSTLSNLTKNREILLFVYICPDKCFQIGNVLSPDWFKFEESQVYLLSRLPLGQSSTYAGHCTFNM